ncbi:glycerol-3-phosphate dehydrogenase subunit GlpB [Desulfospira joergensenii]|uniref:glycerol-3-phosphate dehydrogenase subunit GlpB n=1 Tax=Desulfospira joergensenii TaxID=53329 RepID=UPI0003B512CC|nr:glycerol-3-phosphate dehydrogenase subunit GlpB [Desulfospira joergensenii]
MDRPEIRKIDLAIIGSGMAGISAAAFALNREISFIQAGQTSELSFSSGCLDLFSILPGKTPRHYTRPFDGIPDLVAEYPGHPYGLAGKDHIRQGFEEFTSFMKTIGIQYHMDPENNQYIITPAGTLKPTYAVPLSMLAGSRAVKERQKILIADIRGLKGFGARQMALGLQGQVPGIKSATVEFPGREDAGDLMCERLTWDLENPGILSEFARRILPHTKGMDAVGLPAILGIYRFDELRHKIEKIIGAKVFEIPTLAPSVTGMRLKEAFLGKLTDLSVPHFSTAVKKIDMDKDKNFVFKVSQGQDQVEIRASFLLMATGRFMGRGLGVEKGRIKENLFDLPVTQAGDRSQWFHRDFFDSRGHGVNRTGIETDEGFRPLQSGARLFHPRLYAAGSILAHQDWKREKSGAGISIAGAHKAVSEIARALGKD